MKLTIARKQYLSFASVLLLLLIISATSLLKIQSVNNSYQFLLDDRVTKIILVKDMVSELREQFKEMRGFVLSGNQSSMNNWLNAKSIYDEKFKILEGMENLPAVKQNLQDLKDLNEQYLKYAEQLQEYKNQNKSAELSNLISTTGNEISKNFFQKANEIIDVQQKLLDETRQQTDSSVNTTIEIVIWISVAAIAIGISVAIIISRMVSVPVSRIAQAANQIAGGDLTEGDLYMKSRDEIGELGTSFNRMKRNLLELISGINNSANQVAESAEELYVSTEEVSKTALEVKDRIQGMTKNAEATSQASMESSLAMQESAAGIQRIAESAQVVSETSVDTLRAAEEGNKAVDAAITQMNTIKRGVVQSVELADKLTRQSEEISKITSAITEITSQTNLLALNAAIEAARAGENGRGFAVVAGEVRKLAEQSKDSANQIISLITLVQQDTASVTEAMRNGAREVESGVKLMDKVGDSFRSIRSSIQTVTGQVQEISASAEQMSASTEQVTASVEEMTNISNETSKSAKVVSSATQEQLATIQEINIVSSTMSKMAVDFQEMLKNFKV
ncbi:methyl-accepting chemotaxis protein [Paenibacillus sp. LjRoot153]|uniref:methyl-accepting chemotaxis protein n=1 Tax=Paenibacillus sp. LjRoot153 TaxID=3342270 RepID=UPI003ED066B4